MPIRLRLTALTLALLLPMLAVHAQPPTPTPGINDLILATNTPRPPATLTTIPRTPDRLDLYALRLWTSDALVQLLETQLEALIAAGPRDGQAEAVQFTVYEITRRFPTAFERAAIQNRLLPLMLAAPPGSVDMRPLAEPTVARLLTEAGTLNPDANATVTLGAFKVTVQPLNATPLNTQDVLLTVTAPAGATDDALRYHSVLLAREQNGIFRVLPANPAYPVAPLNAVTDLELLRVGDLNLDGVDEWAVSVGEAGAVNRSLVVYGVQAGAAIGLTRPSEPIRYREIDTWESGESRFVVVEARRASTFWGCIEGRRVTWAWGANIFAPSVSTDGYTRSAALSCELDAVGNVFALSPADAITRVTSITADAPRTDTTERAALVTATLYTLNGQPNEAVASARRVIENAPTRSARVVQAEALLAAIGRPDLTPLQVCGLMAETEPDPLCDIEAVVLRELRQAPITAGEGLAAQFAARGIPIIEAFTLQQVGRADRPAVGLALGRGLWLSFEPDPANEADLIPTVIDTPAAFVTETTTAPATDLPDATRTLLLTENNYRAVIAALESLQGAANVDSLSPRARFTLALAHDLAGNRARARQQYYDLWDTAPDDLWGRLAAAHLERRG